MTECHKNAMITQIANAKQDWRAVKVQLFEEIVSCHWEAKGDTTNPQDYIATPNAARYRLLLAAWWGVPYGLPFRAYRMGKGQTPTGLNDKAVGSGWPWRRTCAP